MSIISTSELIDKLYGTFSPIYSQWCNLAPSDTNLWDMTRDKESLELLEGDLVNIGRFFADADHIGTQSEYSLLAECIAQLRQNHKGKVSNIQILESEIDKIADAMRPLIHDDTDEKVGTRELRVPITWSITKLSFAKHVITSTPVNAYRECLLGVANQFLFHDGNLTPEEDERFRLFHAALG